MPANKVFKNGRVWFLASHITNLSRKYFGFRMIGNYLYMAPIIGASKQGS